MLRIALVVSTVAFAAESLPVPGWDRQKAFDYLEARQKQWAEWKPAQKHGGPCISCHTGLSYLVSRRVIGERNPRPLEHDLVQGVRARLLSNPRKTMLLDSGAEAILSLLTLALQRRSVDDPLDEADRAALKDLWAQQAKDGSWSWFHHDLHPVESEHSKFYAAALVEMALSAYPADPADRVEALRDYMKREAKVQPLHNRMAWVAFGGEKNKPAKAAVLQELWAAQSDDGGWTNAALGPWAKHEDAPADAGSSAYATAWAAFTAREAGVGCSDAKLRRAMEWLSKHQDRATGAWNAVSMNKAYPEGSMQAKFMTDAATGWAAAALLGCKQ